MITLADIGWTILLAEQTGERNSGQFWWVPLAAIGLLFYFMLIRPERRKRADHSDMLSKLKNNDRVVTVGGIFGTVVNAPQGSEDVVIRVDDNTNARLKVLRSSVSRILSADDSEKS